MCLSNKSLTTAVRFLSEVHMNASHVMLVNVRFGCDIKSSSSDLCSLCSPLLLFPSGAGVSRQMAEDRGICGGGGGVLPSESRDSCHLPQN